MTRILFLFILFHFVSVRGQQVDVVDFTRIHADLEFEDRHKVLGSVSVWFTTLKAVDSVYLDAVAMDFSAMKLTLEGRGLNKKTKFLTTSDKLILKHEFKENTSYVLEFSYVATPQKALYFIDDQIWTQGQGQYTSHWLPSIDDMNEKIEFDLSVTYDTDYVVLANGVLVSQELVDYGRYKWSFDMTSPMSSYLLALAIGKYVKQTELSNSGIPLEYYYYPEDSLKVEPTYRYSKQMFDFLETEIGVPYPWHIYRQVPVKDFLYSGMENTSLTIFTDALVVDAIAYNDENYVNVNAHELAHQWFGNLVTATSSTHHWLQEGFATYYALLAEKEVFGDDYFYWQLYDYAQQLLAQENAGKSTSLLDPKSSSVTFYQKGCWALHILREHVGDQAFKLAVKNYLLKHRYKNVETSDFIKEVEQTSGQDLTAFVATWLETAKLPQDAMVKSLEASAFIREFLEESCENYPDKCEEYLVSDISDKAKIKILEHDGYDLKLEDFNNGLEVRQAIAAKLTSIPLEFKEAYESFLNDASYVTVELALYNLWVNFPTYRAQYLQQTNAVYGFHNYNVRMLWLVLHLNTIEYQPDRKQAVFEELRSYSGPEHGFDRRINAFKYLKLINGFDEVSIANLIQAETHHNWRFKQFARQLIEELEGMDAYKYIIDDLRKAKDEN